MPRTPPRPRPWPLAATALLVLVSACGSTPPKPWEKDLLARPAMAIDADALEARVAQHVYDSREAASGGLGIGGGGCGCN